MSAVPNIARSEISRKAVDWRAKIFDLVAAGHGRIIDHPEGVAFFVLDELPDDADLRDEILAAVAAGQLRITENEGVAIYELDEFPACSDDADLRDDEPEPAGDEVPPAKPRHSHQEIRGPPRRAPSFKRQIETSIAVGKAAGAGPVKKINPDASVEFYLPFDALDQRAELNPFAAPLLPRKRGRS